MKKGRGFEKQEKHTKKGLVVDCAPAFASGERIGAAGDGCGHRLLPSLLVAY